MMSYVDWVRARVGSRKIFLVFSSVVLQNEAGQILLQRRTDFDVWGLPGGVLEMEEDLLTCARRELLEESGLTVATLALVGLYSDPRFDVIYPNGDQVQQFTVCFRGLVTGGRMQVDGAETEEQAFFDWPLPEALPVPIWYRAMLHDAMNGGEPAFRQPASNGPVCDQIATIRPYIGSERFIAVGASCAVVREDGRLLMVQRRDDGRWLFPAGFMNLGENAAQTAVREVKEETGLDVMPQRILGIYSSPLFHHTYPNGHRVKVVGVLFRARLVGGTAQVDGAEIARMAWMAPAQVLDHAPERLRPYFMSALAHLEEGHFMM